MSRRHGLRLVGRSRASGRRYGPRRFVRRNVFRPSRRRR